MTASKIALVIVISSFVIYSAVLGQEQPKPTTPPADIKKPPAAGAVIPPPEPRPVPPREQLEKEFQDALTGATLEGTWQMTGKDGLKGPGLTDPKPDKYTIKSATKTGGDTWVIVAQIDFGDNDAFIPVPVRVVWAEDTAIITLNDLAVPMIGTYSARVMIHNGFYSGVWYCNAKNYGGVMQGRIVKMAAPAKPAEEKPTP
jgi:hypothetical protein